MCAASARRSRRYLRNWSVTASASSTVAAASTLSAPPLPGPLRSWPAKSIRRGAAQRVCPPHVDGQERRRPHYAVGVHGSAAAGDKSLIEEQLVDFEHHR